MDRIIRNALLTLDCDDKQIRLFLACYARGTAALSELAKTARLQRSTAYIVMRSLLGKGLVSEDYKTYGKAFTAISPEELIRKVAAKQRRIGRQHLELQEHLGELQALYQTSQIQPRVRTYQSLSGFVSILQDILGSEGELLIWTNQATETKIFNSVQHNEFIEARKHSGRPARVLAVDNAAGRALQASDADNLRTTRLLPPDIDFSAETYIYGSKIATVDHNQDIIGIIVESSQVAQAQRAMFEAAWQAAACAA